MTRCSQMLLCSLSHCAACLLWVSHPYRKAGRGAGPCGTVYAVVLCLTCRSKGQVTAQIHQGFSFLFLPKLCLGNQQGLTGRTQTESNSASQPPYCAHLQWVWKVAEENKSKESSALILNIIHYWAKVWFSCRLQVLHTFLNHLVAACGQKRNKLLPFLLLNEVN